MRRSLVLLPVLLLFVGFGPALVRAASPEEECLALYDAGSYAPAAECLLRFAESGHRNGHVWFDAGCAWLRAGETGRAVHALRTAQLFLPRDGDVEANLRVARESVVDDLPLPDGRGPFLDALLKPTDALNPSELLLGGVLLWALGWGLLAARLRVPSGPLLGGGLLATLLGTALLGVAWARLDAISDAPVAVVIDDEVTLRSGRDVRSVDLALLHEGTEVVVVLRDGDWSQIRLGDGKRGWMPAISLLEVRW